MPSLSGRPSQIYVEGALNTVGIDIGVIGAGGPDRRITALRWNPSQLKGGLRWVSLLGCQPFNCGTSPKLGQIRHLAAHEAWRFFSSGRRRRQGNGARRLPGPRNGLASDAAIGNLSG